MLTKALDDEMEALRWHGSEDVRLETVPVPSPTPGFSLVEVRHCGICGTDLNEYRHGPNLISTTPHPLTGQAAPVTLGHELSGVVVGTGNEGPDRVGTRVTVDACWRCGRCDACVTGDYHLCRYGGSIGLHSDGGFAPFVVVPDYCLVELPERVSFREAAMTEPFAVALHGLERGMLAAADAVVVLGFGPIGACAAVLARVLGARVKVIDPDERRATLAEELGFAVIEAGPGLPGRVRSALRSGGADLVVEASGVAEVIPDAIDSVRRGGRIVQLGMGGQPAAIYLERLVLLERALIGSLGYRHHLPKVLRMMDEGLLRPETLIGDTVPLAEAAGTLRLMASGARGDIKVLVDPHG